MGEWGRRRATGWSGGRDREPLGEVGGRGIPLGGPKVVMEPLGGVRGGGEPLGRPGVVGGSPWVIRGRDKEPLKGIKAEESPCIALGSFWGAFGSRGGREPLGRPEVVMGSPWVVR